MNHKQIYKKLVTLPVEDKLLLRELITDAGLETVVSGDLDKVFLKKVKESTLSFKAKQAITDICANGHTDILLEIVNEKHLEYLETRETINTIESELRNYFLSKGWVFDEPYFIKKVNRGDSVFVQKTLRGLESKTRKYAYMSKEFDKNSAIEFEENDVKYTETFKQLKELIK